MDVNQASCKIFLLFLNRKTQLGTLYTRAIEAEATRLTSTSFRPLYIVQYGGKCHII